MRSLNLLLAAAKMKRWPVKVFPPLQARVTSANSSRPNRVELRVHSSRL